MPRPSISKIKPPPRKYRVDSKITGERGVRFESAEFSRKEDRKRARQIRKAAVKARTPEIKKAALALADRLDPSGKGKRVPRSLASSRYMRKHRKRVVGAIWQLVDERADAKTFTLIPRGIRYPARRLNKADARKLMAALRSDLNRCGAADADGWLIAFLHGEYESTAGVYQLHYHCVATGGMLRVVDRLRKRRKYKSQRTLYRIDGEFVWQRVRFDPSPLYDLPKVLSYALKSYWPDRPRVVVNAAGDIKRVRHHRRIPEPHHTRYLMWLDRWSLADIALLIHVAVRGGRLQVTENAYTNGGAMNP